MVDVRADFDLEGRAPVVGLLEEMFAGEFAVDVDGGQETKIRPKARKNGTDRVFMISLQFLISGLHNPLPRPLDRFQADVDVRRGQKDHTRDAAFAEPAVA